MNAQQRKLRNLLFTLVLILLGLQITLWFSSTGSSNLRELDQRVFEQERENIQLRQNNNTLEAEVSDLKKGLDSVEERARSELGMIAEDETFFQLIEDDVAIEYGSIEDGKESDSLVSEPGQTLDSP